MLETSSTTDAVAYHNLGWCVIPLKPDSKAPDRKWKQYRSNRPRLRDIRRWDFSGGIAVKCGPVSGGLVCRDWDDPEAYHEWAATHPQVAALAPTVSTPSGGFHVYFRLSSFPRKKVIAMVDGELRLQSCLATLPPTRHSQGSYKWTRNNPQHNNIPLLHDIYSTGLLDAHSKHTIQSQAPQVAVPSGYKDDGLCLFGANGDFSQQAFEDTLAWTIPDRAGIREACIWHLARALKGRVETSILPANELRPLVKYWWQRARNFVGTKEWAATWAAFTRAWSRVATPLDGTPLTEIVERAKRRGCPSDIDDAYQYERAGLAAAICRELACEADGGPWYLTCRALGEHLGVSHVTANEYLRALEADSIIRKVSNGIRGEASYFEYLRKLDD